MKVFRRLPVFVALLLVTLVFARFVFQQSAFEASQFNDFEKLQQTCAASVASSFWCTQLESPLTLTTAKGDDFLTNERGEFVAIFAKVNKGQDFRGRYNVDQNQNLVPVASPIPAGAILLDGEYIEPQNVQSTWEQVDEITYRGTFTFRIADVAVTKIITISNIQQTLDVSIEAERVASDASATSDTSEDNAAVEEGETSETSETSETTTETTSEPTVLQYVLPGIARTTSPLVKLAQGANDPVNIVGQAVDNPSYISLQTSRAGPNSFALILRPAEGETDVQAQVLSQGEGIPANTIAMQKTLGVEEGSSLTLNLRQYNGANELVRYYQEGYRQLPGLFQPNIIGQLSIGVLWFLERLHGIIGNWGLSISPCTTCRPCSQKFRHCKRNTKTTKKNSPKKQ
jgi:hypothetical protein